MRSNKSPQLRISLAQEAARLMYELKKYTPCLIGSVSTGQIRRGSDIDLHLFSDCLEELFADLDRLGKKYEFSEVSIRKNSQIMLYTRIYLQNIFLIELSVYPRHEIRVVSRSSTDSKPIVRLKTKAVEVLLQYEHEAEWIEYLSSGKIKAFRN